ncbi:MAG: hypothetical protein KGO94_11950 [Alphaproteobacteria bacterium]|nr:hypothetical protein [Alphaproteobacteria bacterium]
MAKPTVLATLNPPVALQVPLNTGAIVLRTEQLPMAEDALNKLDFGKTASGDIVKLGLGAEQALQRTLDGFLSRLDQKAASRLFDLFGQLEKGVEDAKLPEILERIQSGAKPGFLAQLWGKLSGKKPEDLIRDLMEEVGGLVSGRTKTLADKMQGLESELQREMQKLFGELKTLESLKQSYATHFDEFTLEAGVARAFLDKAKAFVEVERSKADAADVQAQARMRDLEERLRLLESRALALEGTYTRLPADQMVIQQIEQAGVATLQETATTVASRFASIKMTLLSLQGAFAVKTVQQIGERQARLDEQLTKVRNATIKDVAVTAAKAPGENRLAQAKQIEGIVASTREIHGLIADAKKDTTAKFDEARAVFANARQALADLQAVR